MPLPANCSGTRLCYSVKFGKNIREGNRDIPDHQPIGILKPALFETEKAVTHRINHVNGRDTHGLKVGEPDHQTGKPVLRAKNFNCD